MTSEVGRSRGKDDFLQPLDTKSKNLEQKQQNPISKISLNTISQEVESSHQLSEVTFKVQNLSLKDVTVINGDSQNPDKVLKSLLEEMTTRQKSKKSHEMVALFISQTNKWIVRTVDLKEIDLDFFRAQIDTDQQVQKLFDAAQNNDIISELSSVLSQEMSLMKKDHLTNLQGTLDRILCEFDGISTKRGSVVELKILFRVFQKLVLFHNAYLESKKGSGSEYTALNDLIQKAMDLREKVLKLRDEKKVQLEDSFPAIYKRGELILSQLVLNGCLGEELLNVLNCGETARVHMFQRDKSYMSELVRTYPEILRFPECPKDFLNDFTVIYNAVAQDPSICLIAGEELRTDKESFKRIMREALASLILGNHSVEIQKNGSEIHQLAKMYLPEPGFLDTDFEKLDQCMDRVQNGISRGVEDLEAQDQIEKLMVSFSYSQIAEAMKNFRKTDVPMLKFCAQTIRYSLLKMSEEERELCTDDFPIIPRDKDMFHCLVKTEPRLPLIWGEAFCKEIGCADIFYSSFLDICMDGLAQECGSDQLTDIVKSESFPKSLLINVDFLRKAIKKNPEFYDCINKEMDESSQRELLRIYNESKAEKKK